MKRKLLSVLLVLVLALSLCLVTAVPVAAADPGDVEFSTAGDGIAEWTTEEAHSGSYSVKFHTDTWDWTYKYAVGIPVDISLNELTELSYWKNGVSFPGKVDYAPPDVLLCIDANGDGELDFDIDSAISDGSLLGDDAILVIGADWIATDVGWLEVDGLHNSYWAWGGAYWIDKNGWSGWVGYASLEEVINAGGFNPSDAGFPCPIDPTDNVMLVVIAGGNPDGDVYVDDITVNGTTYELEPPPIDIDLDIKPGSDPNSINPNSKGLIPVAILGSTTFDVTDVDVTTLQFGPLGATPAHDLTNPVVYAEHLQDVNGDGFTDLVSHYRTQDTGIAKGDTNATLTGKTTGGIIIDGSDSIRAVGK